MRKVEAWPKPSKVVVILVIIQIAVVVFTHIAIPQGAIVDAASTDADLQCHNASSEIILDSWGNIYFHNTYSIQEVGSNTIQVVILQLPFGASEVSVYDALGSLSFTTKNTASEKDVNVTLRYPLRENSNIRYFDTATFSVSYRMSSSIFLASSGSWTQYILNLTLPTGLNLTIKSFDVKVTLPEGAVYLASSISGSIPTGGLTPMIEYVFQNVNPRQVFALTINYEYHVFWSALRPTFLLGGVTVIIGTLIFSSRRGKQPKMAMTDTSVTLIETFTENCDERLMLWSEMDSLEDSLDQKGIGRRDYNRRKIAMRQRLETVERTLTNLKTEVRQIGLRYTELISGMEKTETEITVLRENMERSRTQYRSGRLPRRTYMELKDSYGKKVEGAKRSIESTVIEFKREI